ncbi:hypothetical protein AB0B27_31085 [Micromonospora rifamycinica]|uniref:hypothetical protein n=1 Tax=Micromonospora rifamycinica TaxID=291594 RepID=UPI0033EBA6F6
MSGLYGTTSSLADSDWYRRSQAAAAVPSLPDDDDIDTAVTDLRSAVHEAFGSVSVSGVLRVLRHRRGLAAEVLHKAEPTCRSCGSAKQCLGCDDVRPRADQLGQGWRWVSPLNRWETVERVERANQYAPVRVWTDKTGPAYSWLIDGHHQVDAVAPLRQHGVPEIRVVEYEYSRDAPMFAVATLDTVRNAEHADRKEVVAEAYYSREHGWRLFHRPDGGGDRVVVDCGSKAKARTALRAAARAHAKALGVRMTVQPRRADR